MDKWAYEDWGKAPPSAADIYAALASLAREEEEQGNVDPEKLRGCANDAARAFMVLAGRPLPGSSGTPGDAYGLRREPPVQVETPPSIM